MSYILSVLWGFSVPLEFIGLTFTNTEYFPSHIYVTVFIEFYNLSPSYCLAEVNGVWFQKSIAPSQPAVSTKWELYSKYEPEARV